MFIRTPNDGARLSVLCDEVLDTIWRSNPVGATILGIHKYDHVLGDVSADGFKAICSSLKDSISVLESEIVPGNLDPEQELNRQLALSLARSQLILFEDQRSWENNPSVYGSQAVWGCMGVLMRCSGCEAERLRPVLDRMREIPEMLAESKKNLRNPASVFVQIALGVNQGSLSFFRDDLPGIVAGSILEREIYAEAERAVLAFEDYGCWLREDVLPSANGDFAVGESVYAKMLEQEHCLSLTPAELVDLGERALHDAEREIANVASGIAPSMSWPELVAQLKHAHPPRESLVDAYRNAYESARDFVTERGLATVPDDADLCVDATPEVERYVMPFAAYFPPAPFGDCKTGRLWVTPVDEQLPQDQQYAQLLEHCIYAIPIIALHEGIPGHHLQLTRAMESPHPVRRQMLSSLLMEGWALYCEELMQEQGFYADPRVRLFQLKDMIWRACRVIIDVGLHTGQMSLGDAVDMLADKACIEEAAAAAEVRRYSMSPTQPMTYAIGKLLLLDLRGRMNRKLGSRFDLKDFHDTVLSFGSIPTPLIVERMTADASVEPRILRSA